MGLKPKGEMESKEEFYDRNMRILLHAVENNKEDRRNGPQMNFFKGRE